MMNVGIVGVRMRESLVRVPVRVWLATVPGKGVLMLMMRVMPMRVLVLERFVRVLMRVPLGEMQPHAHCHQRTCQHQCRGERLAVQENRERRTEEGRE